MSVLGPFLALVVGWLIFRATRQFRAYAALSADRSPPLSRYPEIAVVVPARNEADVIGSCLAGVAGQDYPPERLAAVVVDDDSSDETAAIIGRYAAADGRIRMLPGGMLPAGWVGKPHACWRGAIVAGTAEWLCFIDADTRPAPNLLSTAIHAAEDQGLDFLSLAPRQELVGAWERLVLPASFYALAFTRDLRRTNDHGRGEAFVNGQFILVRRDLYFRAGGHAAARAAIAEDSALAVSVKAQGGRIALRDGTGFISVRMYRDLPALWQGLSKISTQALGGASRVLAIVLLGVPLAWALAAVPIALAAAALQGAGGPGHVGSAFAACAWAAALGLHLAGARHFRIPLWYGLLFPLGYTLAGLLAIDGLVRRRTRRIAWKGRLYAEADASSRPPIPKRRM